MNKDCGVFAPTAISVLILLLSSCGIKEKKREHGPFFDMSYAEDVEKYDVFDHACQNTDENFVLESFYLYPLHEGIIQRKLMSFDGFVANPYLKGRYFSSIIYNEFYKGVEKKGRFIGVKKEGTKLKICEKKYDYGEKTIETAALTALYDLNKSFLFHEKLSTFDLPPVRINIHPIVQRTNRPSASFLSNNAAFIAQNKEIVIYPQSKKDADRGRSPLWKVPGVLAHEFGHYLLMTYFPSHHLGNIHYKTSFVSEKLKEIFLSDAKLPQQRVLGQKFVYDAFGEGFADMFSFYSSGEDQYHYRGLGCFFKTRDVNSFHFYNGDKKSLTGERLRFFLSEKKEKRFSVNCAIPDYQSIHTLGAIIAYGVNALWSEFFLSSVKKGQLLIRWAYKLEGQFSLLKKLNPEELLNKILDIAFSLIKQKKFTNYQCQIIKNTFPYFNKKNNYCL